MKRQILLGLTGSVATVLHTKLIEKLRSLGEVNIILTERAEHFVSDGFNGVRIFRDKHEWTWYRSEMVSRTDAPHIQQNFDHKWTKDDQILHIKLRDSHSALVIAPCSANTLAKISNGMCDNLLTSVARAWDLNRPFVIAPAMNTRMWEHPITEKHLSTFLSFSKNNHVSMPQSKLLACGDNGMGALGEIDEIVAKVKDLFKWQFPLKKCNGIPMEGHPGSFACQRKYEKHTGVDLYCEDGSSIFAVESGTVVGREPFTGPGDKSPWWNDTDCLLVEGATGVVVYGEISIPKFLVVGSTIERGQYLGNVKRVLKEGKERPDIMGHSTSMLHMELYPHGHNKASHGFSDFLNDVTPFLLESDECPVERLTS